jgi:hypothetical protein
LCRFIKESHQAFRNFLLKYSLPMGRYRALDVHEQAGPFTESRERLERIWRLGVNARPVILHGLEEAPIDLGSISPSSVRQAWKGLYSARISTSPYHEARHIPKPSIFGMPETKRARAGKSIGCAGRWSVENRSYGY